MFVPKTAETREVWTVGQTCALPQVRPRRSNAPQQTFKDIPVDCKLFLENVIPLSQIKNQSNLFTNQMIKSLLTFVSFARVLAQGLPVNCQFSVSRNLQPVTV